MTKGISLKEELKLMYQTNNFSDLQDEEGNMDFQNQSILNENNQAEIEAALEDVLVEAFFDEMVPDYC
jgi:hypothetical protein